jgi:xylulokinase
VNYLLGIDVGSSDCKAMVITLAGDIAASCTQAYPTHYPRASWAEQNPEDWYQAACTAVRGCLSASAIDPHAIVGIAVDGPAHNVALMDARGDLLRSTIHWSDLRSKPQAERLEASHGEHIFDLTATRPNPSWTLAQLLWLKDNQPDIWARLRRILVTKDYVRFRFTGGYQTDIYDAIGTQMYDLHSDCWSDELCDLLGFDPAWLPPAVFATAVAGPLQASAAHDTGLVAGTPVAVSSGDSVVEAFGIGAVTPGDCIVKLGTAANVNLVTAEARPSAQTITYRHIAASHWFTITPTNSGASTMRWFRDTFCRYEAERAQQSGISVYQLIDELALGAPAGSDGLLFHPYLMGERAPYWDPDLRGDFIGIRAHHRLNHFSRAILEGVAFSIRDCVQVVESLGQPVTSFRLIGGGAKSQLWQQVMADVLGQPLLKPAVEDAAFGAALLAGVAVGVFTDVTQAAQTCAQVERTLQPDPAAHQLYNRYFELYRAAARDLMAHNHSLAQLTEGG